MKIRIRDFQAYGDASLEATGFTVIVGPSNLGKSAAIRAISSALFNRAGEGFVRRGATVSTVAVTGLPAAGSDQPHTVVWLKGHNTNEFVIDRQEHKKVGVGAPDALQELGYRDVWIGDKERSKGEDIRPQVAEQFDPLFLLKRPGSFISDVLSVISRLAVLLRAHQRSASDLRSQKQLLNIRRKDLEAAETALDAMAPMADCHARVSDISDRVTKLREDYGLVEGDLRPLVTRRAQLGPLAAAVLPRAVTVPEDVGQAYLDASQAVADRRRLAPLALATLPAQTPPAEVLDAVERAAKVRVLEGLLAARSSLAGPAAAALPPSRTYPLEKIGLLQEKLDKIRTLARQRQEAAQEHFDAVSTLKASTLELEQTQVALSDIMAELKVCPVCDRPMEAANG